MVVKNRQSAAKAAFKGQKEDPKGNVPEKPQEDNHGEDKREKGEKEHSKELARVLIPVDYAEKCQILTLLPGSPFKGKKIPDVIKTTLDVLFESPKYKPFLDQFEKFNVE